MNASLTEGKAVRQAGLTAEELELVKSLMLLTLKPVIYAANVADSDLANGNAMTVKLEEYAKAEGSAMVIVSAQVDTCDKFAYFDVHVSMMTALTLNGIYRLLSLMIVLTLSRHYEVEIMTSSTACCSILLSITDIARSSLHHHPSSLSLS